MPNDNLIRLKLPDGTPAELRLRGQRAHRSVQIEEPETWLEYGLRGGLRAALRLLPTASGELVVAEVRVFPDHDRRDAGRWDPDGPLAGRQPVIPAGGIPSRILREVRVPGALVATRRIMREFVQGWGKLGVDPFGPGNLFGAQGLDATAADEPKRNGPGRPPLGEHELARVAREYVRLIGKGARAPVKDLAKAENLDPSTIRDRLGKARGAGLLTSAPSGKAGGQLTQRAQTLLRPRR